MSARYCDIDDCRAVATILVEGYPDDVALCAAHQSIERADELLPWERIVPLNPVSGESGDGTT